MKTHKNIILIALLLVFTSCSDFLERTPKTFFSNYDIQQPSDVYALLVGAYSNLRASDSGVNYPLAHDFMVDDGFPYTSGGQFLVWSGDMMPDDAGSETAKWSSDYAGILRTNSVLHFANEVTFPDPKLRERYVAEARFLRSYWYADLIEFYGDVPFRLKPENLADKISPRVDKKIILDTLMRDLDYAAAHLPVKCTGNEFGRATKGAALALKARVALNNYLYDDCIKACREVMALGQYQLHPKYSELFTAAVEKTNKETIFSIQYASDLPGQGGTYWTNFYAMLQFQVSQYLVDEYYMKDNGLRFDQPGSGYTNTDPWNGRDPRFYATIYPDPILIDAGTSTGYRVHKFVEPNPQTIHRNAEVDFPIIRYADVLLMLAEAMVEKGGYDYDEVVGLVDQIRQRSDVMMPKVGEVEGKNGPLSTEALREVIRHERRVEFAFEGRRYSDVRRWKIAPEVMKDAVGIKRTIIDDTDPEHPIYKYEPYVFQSRTYHPEKGYLWPIPSIEVKTNPMEQNPGYTI